MNTKSVNNLLDVPISTTNLTRAPTMITHLGRMTFWSSDSSPNSLNVLYLIVVGGCLNGVAPKLNWHCWKDMKLAAAKIPCLEGGNDRSFHRSRFILSNVCDINKCCYDELFRYLLINLKVNFYEPAVGSRPNFARMCG